MNLLKGISTLAITGTVVAIGAVLVLKNKKKEEEEENIIYSSVKEFKEDDTPIEVGDQEEQQVEVAFMDTTGNGEIDTIVQDTNDGSIDTIYQKEETSAHVDLDGDGQPDVEISYSSSEEAKKENELKSKIKTMANTIIEKMRPTDTQGIYVSDANGDGIDDSIVADTNGDGKVDTALVDTNGDGNLDTSIDLKEN